MSQFECYHPIRISRGTFCDTVPCGKCVGCLARRRSDWFIRILSEYDAADTCVFITLTYNEESVTEDQSVSRLDITNFVRRLKREAKGLTDKPLRYFISSEYCPTSGRPHYHGILFNVPITWMRGPMDFYYTEISRIWGNGFVTTGVPTNARLNYVVKYCLALADDFGGRVKPFLVANRRPAIGRGFMSDRMVDYIKSTWPDHPYLNYKGYARPLPRYYKDRINDPEERFLGKCRLAHEDRKAHVEWLKEMRSLTPDEALRRISVRDQFRNQEEQMRQKSVKKSNFNPDVY